MTDASGSANGISSVIGISSSLSSCTSLNSTTFGFVRLYADGRLVLTRELLTSGEQIRLPSGFKAQFWQIEFEARVRIYSVQMATSAKELSSV